MAWSWRQLLSISTCACASEHVSAVAVATGAVTSSILICRRCSLWVGAASFIVGLGLGVVLQDWFLWRYRQQGMYNEFLRRLSILEAELRALKEALMVGEVRTKFRLNRPSSHRFALEDDDDIFLETRSRKSSDDEGEYDSARSTVDSETGATSGDRVARLLGRLDRLLEGSMQDKRDAYTLCLSKRDHYRENAEFQWRMAKTLYNCSQSKEIGEQVRRQMVYEAVESARLAVSLQPECAGGHKWLAILLGVIGMYEGSQQKIINGYKFKEHIDRALTLDPLDYAAHHLNGRWCYGVYMLSWIERKLASTLFATPPTATIEEALAAFLEANRLKPNPWRENNLYISKCYIEKADYTAAADWLRKAQDLPSTDAPDDIVAKAEVDTLLAKYAAY